MGIKIEDNKKQSFDITEWKSYFEKKSMSIPKNDSEFRDSMMNRIVPLKLLTNAILKATKLDEEELDEEYPEKDSKIDKFLEVYSVVYPAEEPLESEEQITEENTEDKDTEDEDTFDNVTVSDADLLSYDDARELFKNCKVLNKAEDGVIRVKTPTIYEGLSVTVNSNFVIKCGLEKVSRNNVLIIDNELSNVIAVGRIVKKGVSDLVTIDYGNIDYEFFKSKTKFNIAFLRVENGQLTGEIIYSPVNIRMTSMNTTDNVLCIDFGTSNTTAGSYHIKNKYGADPELVTFSDVTNGNCPVDYFPTVVYVEDCSEPNNIKYKFGFEAKELEKSGNYESLASVFYQIKHWLIEDSYYPDEIDVFDSYGNTTRVLKKDIVSAYLRHIISLSEDYFCVKFKELHFTAPVKMKYKFLTVIKKLLPDYSIIDDGIDEAGAILFDYISDKFSKWEQDHGEKECPPQLKSDIAVIDCGGGTTDLATCTYTFGRPADTKISSIKIETQFTSGDFNYGGNNITYRIMQLVKMKLALKLGLIDNGDLNKVLERSENDILLDADAENYREEILYADYDNLYKKCEEFFPTQFNNIPDSLFDSDIPKIKRNFYYLWQFAEQVKIIFYREEKEVKKDKWDDAIQAIGDLNLNYLYQKVGDTLICINNPLDDIEITITEIRKVIFGDIYSLLNRILNLKNGLPEKVYDYYRLSGQSCKINLFNELLKEFIPGKRLRALMERNLEHVESISLKKHCIDGSVRYIMYKRCKMQTTVESTNKLSNRIFKLYFSDLSSDLSQEKPVMNENENRPIAYPIKEGLDVITVFVKDTAEVRRKVEIPLRNIAWKDKDYVSSGDVIEELKNGNNSFDWDKTRNKLTEYRNNYSENLFIIAVPAEARAGYGFYFYLIKKIVKGTGEKYKLSEAKYYNYEDTDSSFFDGKR